MKNFLIAVVDGHDSGNLQVMWEYDTLPEANDDMSRLVALKSKNAIVLLEVKRIETRA